MSSTITETGFNVELYDDKIARIRSTYQDYFGAELDVSDESIIGMIIAIQAAGLQDLDQLIQSLFSQFDPDQAQGIFLDFVASFTNTERLPAAPTRAVVSCRGLNGTQILTGTQEKRVAQSSGQVQFILQDDLIIDFTDAIEAFFSVVTVQDSTAYTITVDTTDYTYTSDSTATESEILIGLRDAVNGGSQNITAELSGAELYVYSDDFTNTFSFAVSTINVKIERCGCRVETLAAANGPTPAPAGSIDTIVTPVTGWVSVRNLVNGTTGRLREDDDTLRVRRRDNPQVSRSGTDKGIQQAIFDYVDGVINALVTSNRDDTTDSDGVPPHRVHAIVEGGLDQDIVDTIFPGLPSGIKTYGNTSGTTVDDEGVTQTVYFSRPVDLYVWIKVTIDVNTDYPGTGDTLVKEGLVTLGASLAGIGAEVRYQELFPAVMSVAGVDEITSFTVATKTDTSTPDPGDYAEQNIEVTAAQRAAFAITRIEVTTV